MVVALVSAAALLIVILAGHVVMDLVRARQDYQFYNEIVRLREEREQAGELAAAAREREREQA